MPVNNANLVWTSYALTLRLMLTNLRCKLGMMPAVSNMLAPMGEGVSPCIDPQVQQGVPTPLTTEEHGIAVQINDLGTLKPSAIPLWLQEQVRRISFPSRSPVFSPSLPVTFGRASTTSAYR